MDHKISCSWEGQMKFKAVDEFGNEVFMDVGPSAGGNNEGFLPMPMLLVGLGGCMGVDVKMILDKMRVGIESINVEVIGETDDGTPKTYKEIKLRFSFKGENLNIDKLEKAVKLSEEKYCNVSAILSKSAKIVHEILIL
ncbi:OsmC family protein [Wukongibacter baidiensis]|uniref:OsmC family protein n=1 Tax=Wukongibacter baidiensis TaxID=1723361 RepID=UPI003D7FD34D